MGTWTHELSSYSGNGYHDTSQGGGRIFICRALLGTPGQDTGQGKRPNEVRPGLLADCHYAGGVAIFYNDSQVYTEYLIHWG